MKIAKLQSLNGKYEMLKMGKDENITSFMHKVNELVCIIRCASGKLEESKLVTEVLKSLPASYKQKVIAIEKIWTMTNVTRDMSIGKLSAFELSEFDDSLPKVEFAFKTTIFGNDKQRFDPGESYSRRISRYEKEIKEIEEEE